MDPVTLKDPVIKVEPVIINVSAFEENKALPVELLTVNEPFIRAGPVKGNIVAA